MSQPYKMPRVAIGDVVQWRHNRTSPEPAPAVVTRVGDKAVSLLILPPESRTGIPMDGVRHDSDPDLNRIMNDAGVWTDSASKARLEAVEAILAELLDGPKPAKK